MNLFDCDPQDFRDAPGLGNAAHGLMRRVPVKDFGNMSQAGFRKMFLERNQPLLCLAQRCFASAIDFQVCSNEWAHQPGPHCTLMISAISTSSISCVSGSVLRTARGKASQTVGCKQVLLDGVDNLFCS